MNLSPQLHYQLVYTLTGLLPPPREDSPEALRARNHDAIAKVAAMLPVNANEADLAAQCIAARAQAEDIMRLIREHADDIALMVRLNAQYLSMVRLSLSVEARLMRVQAMRQKRQAIEATASQDAWTMRVVEQSMLKAAGQDVERVTAAAPQENVSEYDPNSHGAASETLMSGPSWDQGLGRPDETGSRKPVLEARAETGQPTLARPAGATSPSYDHLSKQAIRRLPPAEQKRIYLERMTRNARSRQAELAAEPAFTAHTPVAA